MAELFSEPGQSNDLALSAPSLTGAFVPAIDKQVFTDGFGLITPLGGGGTSRNYSPYGISAEDTANGTQLNDLSKLSISVGGGLSYNFEGLVGPQGARGADGLPGITTVIHQGGPNGLFALAPVLEQIKTWAANPDTIVYGGATHIGWDDPWDPMPIDSVKTWNEAAIDEDGSFMLVASDVGIYVSTDSGATWAKRTPADPAEVFSQVTCADALGKAVVLGESSRAEGKIWVTSDSGANWSQITVG